MESSNASPSSPAGDGAPANPSTTDAPSPVVAVPQAEPSVAPNQDTTATPAAPTVVSDTPAADLPPVPADTTADVVNPAVNSTDTPAPASDSIPPAAAESTLPQDPAAPVVAASPEQSQEPKSESQAEPTANPAETKPLEPVISNLDVQEPAPVVPVPVETTVEPKKEEPPQPAVEQPPLAVDSPAKQEEIKPNPPVETPPVDLEAQRKLLEEQEHAKAKERRAALITKILEKSTKRDAQQHEILTYLISVEIKRMTVHAANEGGEGQQSDGISGANNNSGTGESSDKVEEEESKIAYEDELKSFCEMFYQFQDQNTTKTNRINVLQNDLKEKKEQVKEKHERIAKYRRRAVLKSQYNRTGKHIEPAVYEKFEQNESEQMEQIISLMTRTNLLKKRIGKLTSALQKKETLGDGLSMIDFEQLKIETQTLQEKIEARSAELDKLMQRKTGLVHSLVHSQIKLEYLRYQNDRLKETQDRLQEEVAIKKDQIPHLKKRREQLRRESALVKRQSGLLMHRGLLADFDKKTELNSTLKSEIEVLKEKYQKALDEKKRQETEMKLQLKAHLAGSKASILSKGSRSSLSADPQSLASQLQIRKYTISKE